MAHFAKLNGSNVVTSVVVIGNDVPTAAGPLGDNDMHPDGEAYCATLFKTGSNVTWKQTSYNRNFRKNYAGTGMFYDSAKDKFIHIQPYPSWSLDENDDWRSPVPTPAISHPDASKILWWNEDELRWEAHDKDPETEGGVKYYRWDPDSSTYIEIPSP